MQRTSRRHVLAGGAAAIGLAFMPRLSLATPECGLPQVRRISYRVLRKGSPFGEHVLTLRRAGDDLIVRNDIEIVARMFGIPVYRYEHNNEEIWRDGRLQSVSSETDKNGKAFDLSAERRDGVLHVKGRKGELALKGDILTTSLWHPQTPFADRLLDIEDGVMKQVSGRLESREAVPTPGGDSSARHYRLSGEMEREIWYDAACRLVRVEFNTKKDGSRITLEPVEVLT